ncbi:hypothetical protein AKJ41_04245 [candidate division MSBL1 archaeon SCGC-AAA259O05]|uniref:Uncharacterized protein n=1 Tax=candidate division MSBL1 archaeon SCGC-AAA259O05 TaxID=1698271 RepID=A0A133V1B9_9EURY|nr:hypothetical protein AKJ41_04245 [candidate division MSBL1 archaeon SCGC-AAA259O05]
MTENFVKRILGKKDYLISPGEEGLKSVQLANAILYSGLKDEQVNVPVPEEISRNTQEIRFLTASFYKGYKRKPN